MMTSRKKLTTTFLVFGLLFCLLPATAFAVDTTTPSNNTTILDSLISNSSAESTIISNSTSPRLVINDFYATTTTGDAPLRTNFIGDVKGTNITSWYWNFEPMGSDYYSTHPVTAFHTFTHVGVFNTTLTIKDAAGNVATMTKINYINVTGAGGSGRASSFGTTLFTISGAAPLTVHFDELGRGRISYWLWNFGDGKGSREKNPTHTFSEAGKYTVILTVKNSHSSYIKKTVGYVTVN